LPRGTDRSQSASKCVKNTLCFLWRFPGFPRGTGLVMCADFFIISKVTLYGGDVYPPGIPLNEVQINLSHCYICSFIQTPVCHNQLYTMYCVSQTCTCQTKLKQTLAKTLQLESFDQGRGLQGLLLNSQSTRYIIQVLLKALACCKLSTLFRQEYFTNQADISVHEI
jgi:hypothetical protein